jgi:glutathione peroxidase
MTSFFVRHVRLGIILTALACSVFVYAKSTSFSLLSLSSDHSLPANAMNEPKLSSIYDATMKDIDGKPVKLSEYKGKVLLIVNVASKCGYTPQYEGLQKLYEKYKDRGFLVLGFPANNFMGQEPGTDSEIKAFCSTKYNVTFPMFSKISVKGSDIHPLYQYLTTVKGMEGDVRWNFGKFLVSKDGKVLARFDSKDKPESEQVIQAIESALQ